MRHYTIESLPVMTELDTGPTEDDLSKAIDSLTNGKAPGKDGIPQYIIKHGKPALQHHLHVLLLLCWKEETVHQDMRNANIVTLYNNKGDRSDCNSYRGTSLLSVVGKVFARVACTRLRILAERTLPESQGGFRTGRSTIDMIFSFRQLQDKCREQRRSLFIAFTDRTKKVAGIDTTTWEAAAYDRGHWRSVVKAGMIRGEEKIYICAWSCKEGEEEAKVFPPCTPSSTNYLHLPHTRQILSC